MTGKSKRKLLILLLLLLLILPQVALGAESNNMDLDLGNLDSLVQDTEEYLKEYLPVNTLQDLWSQAKSGEINLNLKTFCQLFVDSLFREITLSGALLVQIIALTMIAMILANLESSFTNSISTLGNTIVYLVLIALSLQVFVIAGDTAKDAVHMMSSFLYALAPVLLTLLTAMGGISAVGLFNPALMAAVAIGMNLINTIILPMIYFCGALTVVSYITPKFNLSKMAKLLKDIAMGILGITLTLFTAFLGIIGMAGAGINGLTIKAAKSASGIFIPVIGKTIADVMDTLIGTSLLLKNCIGVLGIICIIFICVFPAIKILVMGLIFRFTAALVQPLGNQRIADALQGLGGVIMMFFGVVAASGIFFFFLISIIIGMGNLTMAIR